MTRLWRLMALARNSRALAELTRRRVASYHEAREVPEPRSDRFPGRGD
jgi:hypothetical protein